MELFKSKAGYASLLVNCEGYWDIPLSKLPTALKSLVSNNYSMYPWDELNPMERRNNAAQIDSRQDPQLEPSTYYLLSILEADLIDWISKAKRESKDAAELALRDVALRVGNILSVDRERVGTEIQRLTKAARKSEESIQSAPSAQKPIEPREREGMLNIIGGLLELMQDQRPTRANTANQTKIINALLEAYEDKAGISQRNLEQKFADANRSLTQP
jgi:hypothetical protein